VHGNWSAFEHTLTPLQSGGLSNSFLSLLPWNSGKEVCKQGSHLSSVSNDQQEHFSISEMMPEHSQISVSLENDINSRGSTLREMASSLGVMMSDGDTGVKPASVVNCTDSQRSANNCFNTVSVTSPEAQMLKDLNCQTVSNKQIIGGHYVKDSLQTKDVFNINKPVKGKENVRPSGSQSEVQKLNAGKRFNSERQSVNPLCTDISRHSSASKHSKNQESGSSSQWRSPLRHSVNNKNAKNTHLTQGQLYSRDSGDKRTVLDVMRSDDDDAWDMNEAFTALSVASSDSGDSYVNLHSPNTFAEDGLNTNSDEVYKRCSSTPDQSLQEPIRFRHQQYRSSSDEAGNEQRKSSLQRSGETSAPACDSSEPVTQMNEQSLATQRTVAQADDIGADMNAVLIERLSTGALSSGLFCDGDTTYESTVLLSLPARGNAESADSLQDTSCTEAGTQTSLLLHSNDRKTNTPLTSGITQFLKISNL